MIGRTILGMLVIIAAAGFAFAADREAGTNRETYQARPWGAIVVGEQTEAEAMALLDLQRYLGQVTGACPRVMNAEAWMAAPAPAIVLGTPASNPLLVDVALDLAALGAEGYHIEQLDVRGQNVIIASGGTPRGAVNAVYGLLRELGFGFYLGSEALPDRLPVALPVPRVVRAPVFAVRGVLPWYNFFNSPTTWDPIDHRAFADQLIRMGANFLGFHTYDQEPFAGIEENGEMKWAGRLLSTSSPTWGTSPLAASEFPYGIDRLFPYDYFGAETTRLECAAAEAVREEQNRMRDALDYAARRGLHTCIGFEITGDPTVPEYRDAFLKRLEHVLDQYPRLDMVWLWQSETQGVQGFAQSYQQHQLPSKMDASSPLALYGAARRETFLRAVERTKGERPFLQENEAGKQARANEGARFEQFAQLALHVLAHRQNAPRLILSGWGGEDRLLSAEYYDGLDKLLPQDVIFSSLDFIAPRETVDSIYAELPAQRERWPIVWLECDGDQWHPQPWVHTLEKNVRNIREGGSQGILGIHWRTRDIEENFGYAMAYAWNPDLDPEGFFRDLAQRCYAKPVVEEMAAIHSELDLLGYRWLGGGGQNECAPFSWGQGDPAKRDALAALRGRVEQALTATKAAGSNQGRKRLQWLLAAMDWSLAYDAAQKAVLEASGLMAQARTAQDPAATKELAAKALTLLEGDSLAQALHAYARRVTTRGEYGVLATINTKAWVAWRDLLTECRKLAGAQDAPPPTDWQPEPQILLPRFLGSVRAQEELTLMPVVLGGQPAWAHYRAIGARRWISLPMETIRGWVKRVSIPAEAIQEPGIEIVFSFEQNLRKGIALGPIGVTVMPATPVDTAPRPRVAPTAETPALTLEAREGTLMPVELAWDAIPEADYYRVYRDDAVTVETAVPYFPDMPAAGAHAYRVEAIRGGAVLTASESVSITSAAQPVTPLTDLKAETNRAGVLLRWTRPWSPLSGVCTVERRAKDGTAESWEKIGETPASGFEGGYRDTPPAGEWVYRVTPMGAGGSGEPLTAAASFQPLPVPEPALDLPLTTQPEGADVQGAVEFGPEGARFSGGWITLPHQSWMDLGTGMTLDFEFRMDEKTDMPVLLCHGAWQADGWFVQILGNALIVRTPTADANGPVIELGKWYKARFVYDGLGLRLAIDGQDLPQPPATVLTTSRTRPLIIGNYEQTGSIYSFRALMRNIRIYPDVLTADEGR